MTRETLRRWSEDGATRGELDVLRAARAEEPSRGARTRTLAALGLGTTGLLAAAPASLAAQAASKVVVAAVAKWAAIGAVCGAVVASTATTIVSSVSSVSSVSPSEPSAVRGRSAKSSPARPAHAPALVVVPTSSEAAPSDPGSAQPSAGAIPEVAPARSVTAIAPGAAPGAVDGVRAIADAPVTRPGRAFGLDRPPGGASWVTRGRGETASENHDPRHDTGSDLARHRPEASDPPVPSAAWALPDAASAAWALPDAPSAVRVSPDLAREILQLDRVRGALGEGRPQAALSMLERYEAEIGHGFLSPEAVVLRVQALWMAGDQPRARALVDRFSAAHPDSPYRERLRRLVRPAP